MGAEEENELTDVALCYQSMGVALDASPDEIEKMHRHLTEEHKKNLASPVPAQREEARLSLELLDEMYEKIRGSITYRAFQKDYQKKSSEAATLQEKPQRGVHQAVAQKRLMMICPRCNGSIHKEVKTCPICKTPIYSVMEKIMKSCFTPKKLILYCLVVAAVSLGIFAYLNPGKFSKFSGKNAEIDFIEPKDK
jgi:hypothetical protein